MFEELYLDRTFSDNKKIKLILLLKIDTISFKISNYQKKVIKVYQL